MKWIIWVAVFLLLLPVAAAHEEFSFEGATLVGLNEELGEHFPLSEPSILAPLYRLAEEIQMFFAFDRVKKAELSNRLARSRFGEALAVLETGKPAEEALAAFGSEANRTAEQVVFALELGKDVRELLPEIEKTLFGAAVQLDLFGRAHQQDVSDWQKGALEPLARVWAVHNRTTVDQELAGLRTRMAVTVSAAILFQMDIVEGELESHRAEYADILQESDVPLMEKKRAVALRRSETLKKAVEYIELYVRENLAFKDLATLWTEIDVLMGAAKQRGRSVCALGVTPALEPLTGQCADFPAPCEVPTGWVGVERCPQPFGCDREPAPALNLKNGQCIRSCVVPDGWVAVDTCEVPV